MFRTKLFRRKENARIVIECECEECDYEQVDKTIFKWFSLQGSQNVEIDGPILKETALRFAKKF